VARERADARRNRDRLLDAARDAFRRGGGSVQLADVARAAGVGVSAAHRHFPTRDALIETLAREHLARLIEIAERAAADPDPVAAVALMVRQLLDAQFGLHGMSRVLTAVVDAQPETTQLKGRLDAAVATVLTRAQRIGRVRADVTAADLRALVGGIELAADRRDPAARTRADRHLTIVLDGLTAGAQ
jgi:AcrR family transcriptional regulator